MIIRTLALAPTPPVPQSTPVDGPADPPAAPSLQERFTSFAATLAASDETLTKMVADGSPVGTRWGGHFSALAATLQTARDEFLVAKPDAAELAARLGAGVLRLAEASGSMAVFGRQRSTLAEGWSTYLDPLIADATAAAALLAPAKQDEPAPVQQPASEAVADAKAAVAAPGA